MFKKVENVVEKIEEWVISLSVILMAILLIVSVIMRVFFNHSLTFSEELGQFLLIIVSFFGIGFCVRKNKHINMSIIFDAVNKKNKRKMMILISGLSTIITAVLGILSLQYIMSVFNFGRTSPALNIPMFWFYISVTIGFFFGTIEYLRIFIMNIKNEDDVYLSSEVNIDKTSEVDDGSSIQEREG
ncbi:TRAP transporter small permease [Schnuerera sp. xch1]|uniref:TRAP transporter small permease n=1 Tax=Schnuerera sp. xch1 TaxID=2874283 RepID=UPI001CBD48D3|nr:TRAP transporter small permease [Schnuerera sp. xch1]MBZ2174162.1 TRAP transporter small permease [Schnuerera sp. xch1]